MRTHQTAVALTALFVLAACGQQGGSTPGLTGLSRTSFVESASSSCVRAAQSDPRNTRFSAETVAQYCTCYSNKMADTITPDELVTINTPEGSKPERIQALLQPRIDAAVAACRPPEPATGPAPAPAPAPASEPEPNKGG